MRDLRDEVLRRLAGADLAPARALEIADEIAQDLEDRRAELLARGLSPADAEVAVLAQLADHDALARELGRVEPPPRPSILGAPRQGVLADVRHDLRYGLRALVRSPIFTAVTLVSLALGIGANTAIYQLLDSLHMRDLPVREPERLAEVKIRNFESASGNFNSWHADLTNPMWERLRGEHEPFESVLAWSDGIFDMSSGGQAQKVRGLFVSGGFFATLGVPAALGRVIAPADDRRGCGAPAAVVSHGFWQRRLGGDPSAVGRTISLEGHAVEVVGVAPPSFHGLEVGRSFDVALPICMDELLRGQDSRLDQRHSWWLSMVGRLRPGWTVERAAAWYEALSPRVLEATIPPRFNPMQVEMYRAYRFSASPAARGISALRNEYSRPLVFLLLTAGVVLLIACANLANLLLARASAREREIAIRLALGASRGRLIRQLMTESLMLAAAGAALGLLVAAGLGRLLVAFLDTRGAGLHLDLTPDWRVLAFTGGLAALTCLLFGLAPALRASRTDLGMIIRAAGVHGASQRQGLRRALVAVQVALSTVLLVGALLFARSLHNLSGVSAGFDASDVIVIDTDLGRLDVPPERWPVIQEQLLAQVRATPGVAAAGTATVVPISGSTWVKTVTVDGSSEELYPHFNRVSPGTLAALRIPLVAGRDFGPGDNRGAPGAAIVNQSFVRQHLGGVSPLGRRLHVQPSSSLPGWSMEVVGVAGDILTGQLREEPQPMVFLPAAQNPMPGPNLALLVRRSGPLRAVTAAVVQTIADVSPQIGIDIDLLERRLHDSLLRERMLAMVSGFFGLLAAILATIGLYGVVAYGVARRSHEFGIRMALGAEPARIAGMVLRETAVLLAIGLGAGLLLALAATRAAAGMLYGLAPHDPVTFVLAAGLLAIVTLAASALPARRAAAVEPVVALRDD